MKIKQVTTQKAPAAIGPYSQAMRLDTLVFCSGQIGLDPLRGELVDGGIEAETRQTLANLEAVLTASKSSFSSVLRMTVYLLDLADFAVVNRIYAEVLGEARPARSTVGVAALPRGARIEIDAIASRD